MTLRSPVLDLEPRVHLEEIERRVGDPSRSTRNSTVPALRSRRRARGRPLPPVHAARGQRRRGDQGDGASSMTF